jgi:hypothetical protein
MEDRQATLAATDASAKLGDIDPGTIRVQHQQLDVGQEHT